MRLSTPGWGGYVTPRMHSSGQGMWSGSLPPCQAPTTISICSCSLLSQETPRALAWGSGICWALREATASVGQSALATLHRLCPRLGPGE